VIAVFSRHFPWQRILAQSKKEPKGLFHSKTKKMRFCRAWRESPAALKAASQFKRQEQKAWATLHTERIFFPEPISEPGLLF
jgi:hypothetical protein